MQQTRTAASGLLRGFEDDEVFSRSDLQALADVLRQSPTPLDRAMAVRAVAEAFDDARSAFFAGRFRHRGEIELHPHDPVPVIPVTLDEVIRLNTDPDKLESPLVDGTRHLRLAPHQLEPYSVRLSWSDEDVLAPLRTAPRVAVLIPNDKVDDFDWDSYERDGQPLFYRVRPRDSERQAEVIDRLLDRAHAGGSSVVVLPELSTDQQGALRIDGRLRNGLPGLRVVVGGSYHPAPVEATEQRNESVTFLSGSSAVRHRKFGRFTMCHDGSERTEDIQRWPAVIRISMSGSWSLVTLICKDFLEPQVAHLLAELRVRLVLVPAFSEKMQAFEAHGWEMVVNSQAVVVVANAPALSDSCAAVLFRPKRRKPLRMVKLVKARAPLLILWDLKTGEVKKARVRTPGT
jgi:hypothetical protein